MSLSLAAQAASGLRQETAIPINSASQSLLVVNESLESETLWILTPVTAEGPMMPETSFEVAPKAKILIPLKPWQKMPWVKVISASSTLSLYHKMQPTEDFKPWPWGTSNTWTLARGLPHATFWIANLTSEQQNFTLTGIDNGAQYLQESLRPFESRAWVWRGTAGALRLQAQFRVSALIFDALSKQSLPFQPEISDFKNTLPSLPADSARFVLANSQSSQGFVVDLRGASLVSEARDQIANPLRPPKILVAEVSPGSVMNYDPFSPWQAPWSWHVEKVYRFADFGSLDCDGSPQLIEEMLPWWLQTRRGVICFWNYRIQSELP